MVPSFIRPASPHSESSRPPSPTSIFGSAASNLLFGEEHCQHGHAGDAVVYQYAPDHELRLDIPNSSVGKDESLFAHALWNASILLAELIGGQSRLREARKKTDSPSIESSRGIKDDKNADLEAGFWAYDWSVKGRAVLELGTGTALPSIVAVLSGAAHVLATDYPSEALLTAAQANLVANVPPTVRSRIAVEGHKWGDLDSPLARTQAGAFDHVLVTDALWMETQHEALRASIAHFLAPSCRAWIVAGFHTGRAVVGSFFEGCAAKGLEVERLWEVDVNGAVRAFRAKRAGETALDDKRWCVVAVLRKSMEAVAKTLEFGGTASKFGC